MTNQVTAQDDLGSHASVISEQTEPTEKLLDEYRRAGDERRLEMYLFHRELRVLFESIELEG